MFIFPGNPVETPVRYQTGNDDKHANCLPQDGELGTLRQC